MATTGESDAGWTAAVRMAEAERDLHDAIASSAALGRAFAEMAARLLGPARASALGRHDRCLVVAALEKSGGDLENDPALLKAAAAADRLAAAWAELLRSNLRLVSVVARQHAHRGLDLADLVQEGSIGLMKAIDRFDPRHNVKFATYAVWWIRQAIGSALANQSRTIRIPPHVINVVHKIVWARDHLAARLGRLPAAAEIAARLDVPVERVQDILVLPRVGPALSADDDGTGRRGERAKSPGGGGGGGGGGASALARMALAGLERREREVLALRFGIDDGRPRSLRALAREYNMSRDRLKRIERRALRKLRRNESLRDLVDE